MEIPDLVLRRLPGHSRAMSFITRFASAILALLAIAVLNGCANTSATVGITSNEAPKFQELGR
jgi:hypothetical protein